MTLSRNKVDLILPTDEHIPLIKHWLTAREWEKWDARWKESHDETDADREALAHARVKRSSLGIPGRLLICDKQGMPISVG